MTVSYCRKCVYPSLAVNLILDDDGVCSACRAHEEFELLSGDFWAVRRQRFEAIVADAQRTAETYDCIVPVSGGKDSYFQVHTAIEYGLNPLLVTYHGNNYLPEGQRNLDRMRDAFDVDHIVVRPGANRLRRLNRLGFRLMGDMNWHAHAAIKIVPVQMAVKYRVPIVLWGEITWSISGMFSPDDYPEYNKRTVLEHDMRGFTWEDMIEPSEGLKESDLWWLRFPSDEDIASVGTRGIYTGAFFRWEANEHAELMRSKYGFEFAERPFERTYRTMSNLDDMHENGVHDYLKFVKFGYGRATDHASKDVRAGVMSRDEAVDMVRRYDHVKPRRDLERWLSYVGIDEDAFDLTADRFRDPRVWWIEEGRWVKRDLWGGVSDYGPVHPLILKERAIS